MKASILTGPIPHSWRLLLCGSILVWQATLFCPPRNASQWFVTSTGALRYPLFAGVVVRDDIDTTLPFADTLWVFPRVRGRYLSEALRILNRGDGRGDANGFSPNDRRGTAAHALLDSSGASVQASSLRLPQPAMHAHRAVGFGSLGIPTYVAHSVDPLVPEGLYDALTGDFDKAHVAQALRMASGVAVVPAAERYDDGVRTCAFGAEPIQDGGASPGYGADASHLASPNGPPHTDTEAWVRWARAQPQPPCHAKKK